MAQNAVDTALANLDAKIAPVRAQLEALTLARIALVDAAATAPEEKPKAKRGRKPKQRGLPAETEAAGTF